MKLLKNNLAFTLLEVLLVVTLFAIILSSAISVVGNKTAKEDISAKAKQVVDFVARAHDYSVAGFQQDVWSIKILDTDAMCEDNGDCLVLFKGRQWDTRDTGYDRFLNLNTGVYIDADQENEFYFEYMSGWLSTNYNQAITLKSPGTDENKVIIVEASGLTYVQGQQVYGEALVQNKSSHFSMGSFSGTELDGDILKLISIPAYSYDKYGTKSAYDTFTESLWVINDPDSTISKLTLGGRELAEYSLGGSYTFNADQDIVFDPYTNSIWVTAIDGGSSVIIQFDVTDGAILNTVSLDYSAELTTFDSYTNSIWVKRTDGTSNTVFQVNVETATTTAHAVSWTGGGGYDIVFDSENNSIWISLGSSLEERDVADFSLLNTYSTGSYLCYDMVFDTYSTSVWCVDQSDYVAKFDNQTGTILASTTFASHIEDIDFNSTDNKIIAGGRFGEAYQLNIDTGVVENTYSSSYGNFNDIIYIPSTNYMMVPASYAMISLDLSTGQYQDQITKYTSFCDRPSGIAFEDYTNSLWVACYNDNLLYKVNPDDASLISTSSITSPEWIKFDDTNNVLWVSSNLDTTITKVNPTSNQVIASYSVGGGVPNRIIYEAYTDSVWTTIFAADQVAKNNAADGTHIGAYDVCDQPDGIGFDSANNNIWVGCTQLEEYYVLDATDGSFVASSTLNTATNPYTVLYDPVSDYMYLGMSTLDKYAASTVSYVSSHNDVYCDICNDALYDYGSDAFWFADYIFGNSGVIQVDRSTFSPISNYALDQTFAVALDTYTNSIWATQDSYDYISKIPIRAFSSPGYYTSEILDSFSNTEFGTINWGATILAGASITMKIRTSTSSEMIGATDWDSCDNVTNGSDVSSNNCVTDSQRYIQYKAYFTTTNDGISPQLTSVEILYNNN